MKIIRAIIATLLLLAAPVYAGGLMDSSQGNPFNIPAFSGDLLSVAGSSAPTVIGAHWSGTTIGTSGSSYTVLNTDSLLIVNNTSGALFTAVLPTNSTDSHHLICFKRYDSNLPPFKVVVNASPGTDTIEGSTHGLWMGGGTAGGSAVAAPKGMTRCVWSDGVGDWKIVAKSFDPLDNYMRLIPSGDVTIAAGNTGTLANGSMGCYPYDPGVGNAFLKIDEGSLAFTYTTVPSTLLISLTENATGTPHTDGHGWNSAAIPASPVVIQSPGLVDTATSSNDVYAPWQTWCVAANTCTGSGTSWYGAAACCTGIGTGPSCPGGVAVSITASPATNGVIFKKGSAVGSNGADSAELVGVHLRMASGNPIM